MRWALLALLGAGCATADAGTFLSGGFGGAGGGGGGGDVAASWVSLVDIDFTSETTGALTNGASNLLDDGTTNLYGCGLAGTSEIDANGLHFSHTGNTTACLWLSSLSGIANLTDEDNRAPIMAVVQFDTANTMPSPASNDATHVGWHSDGTTLSAGSGRYNALAEVKYDGSTWDIDSFVNDGSGSDSAAQAGNIADFPEYGVTVLYATDMQWAFGDAASFPAGLGDLSEGFASGGAPRSVAAARTFYNATYEPAIYFGLTSAGGEVTISRVAIYQWQ